MIFQSITHANLGGFNLLPYRDRRAAQQRHKHSIGMIIASALGVVIAIAIHYSVLHTTYLHRLQRTKLEQTLAHIQPQLALRKEFIKPIKAQEERNHLAASFSQQMRHFSSLLQALGEIEPVGIRLLDLHFQPDLSTILGTARTQRALSEWVRRLKRIGPFPSVSITQVRRIRPTKPAIASQPDTAPAYAPVRAPLPSSPFIQPFSRSPPNASDHRAHEFAFTVQLASNRSPLHLPPSHSL